MDTICRCCLKSALTGSNFIKLSSLYDNLQIVEIISQIVGDADSLNDSPALPEQLCEGCWLQFKAAYEIRKTYIKSNKYMRQQLEAKLSPKVDYKIKILYDQIDVVNNDAITLKRTTSTDKLIIYNTAFVDVNDVKPELNEDNQNIVSAIVEPNYKCICGYRGSTKYQIRIHIQTHVYPTSCILCDACQSITSETELVNHFGQHDLQTYLKPQKRVDIKGSNNAKPYFCTICGSDYNNFENLRLHMLNHKNKHQAEKWGQANKRAVDKTVKIPKTQIKSEDNQEVVWACKLCDKIFKTESTLKNHVANHDQKYQCVHCGRVFNRLFTLKEHERAQHSDKKYIYCCDLCPRKFSFPHNLTRHKMVHGGIKPFKCEVCNKAFSQLNKMKIHQNIHTGNKPYVCTIGNCSKKFSDPSCLYIHKKKHMCTTNSA